jgi:hypothetical protein
MNSAIYVALPDDFWIIAAEEMAVNCHLPRLQT